MTSTNPVPFLSRAEFNAMRDAGEIKPDALFPIMDYDFCKSVWDTSPLIASLCDAINQYDKATTK